MATIACVVHCEQAISDKVYWACLTRDVSKHLHLLKVWAVSGIQCLLSPQGSNITATSSLIKLRRCSKSDVGDCYNPETAEATSSVNHSHPDIPNVNVLTTFIFQGYFRTLPRQDSQTFLFDRCWETSAEISRRRPCMIEPAENNNGPNRHGNYDQASPCAGPCTAAGTCCFACFRS